MCLEPLSPAGYESSFASEGPVEWKCIIGNLKKWKTGTLSMKLPYNESFYELVAEKAYPAGDAWIVRFSWNNSGITFGEVLETSGHIPLPPYIRREDEKDDSLRYQTVYSSVNGSVAAPTAGLHFTDDLLKRLSENGIRKTDITLHVGAGTFQPVRTAEIKDHIMHREHFFVTNDTISELIQNHDKIISVGTTSVRTIESLYWLGIRVINKSINSVDELTIDQWEPYSDDPQITAEESLSALLSFMAKNRLQMINASTGIIIVPGYKFRLTNGIVTNFHQPRSTLLLLISAWTGTFWKEIYKYALENSFRFLSYGDSSLLFR
jgi:S-adenosylmethionine:tRNA ribosyltransferase-isomerase